MSERFDHHDLGLFGQQDVMHLVPVAARRGRIHAEQPDAAAHEIAGRLLRQRRKVAVEIVGPKLPMPAGLIDDLRAGCQHRLVGPKILRGDLLPRPLRNPQDPRRPVEPVELHLVERLAVVEEVIHRVEVSPLMGRHRHLRDVVAERRRRAVGHDRQLGIHREGLLPVDERMRKIDKRHGWAPVRLECQA